jgi:hypothetical protein
MPSRTAVEHNAPEFPRAFGGPKKRDPRRAGEGCPRLYLSDAVCKQ